MAKTIVFCDDQDHAERMRQESVKIIPAAASDDNEGNASKLLTTGVDARTCKLIVLDQNINSMTEFKQIIGRGTRLREDYQKLYFTIMDFKGATRLFADPDFDGESVVLLYEPKDDEPVVPPDVPPRTGEPDPPSPGPGKPGEEVLDADGKLITQDYRVLLKDDIKRALQAEFGSLTDFLHRWNSAERKQAVLEELADHGVPLEVLQQAVPNGAELDVFDLVAHVAFDQKRLTRRGKYGEQARAVLEALLDKFADHGVQNIEDANVLELPRSTSSAARHRSGGIFGGVEQFTQALKALKQDLYEENEKKQARPGGGQPDTRTMR